MQLLELQDDLHAVQVASKVPRHIDGRGLLAGGSGHAHSLPPPLRDLRTATLLRSVDGLRCLVGVEDATRVGDRLGDGVHHTGVDELRLEAKLAVEVPLDDLVGHLNRAILVLRALHALLDRDAVGAAPRIKALEE